MLNNVPEPGAIAAVDAPHASLLVAVDELAGLRANVWMGGAHSHVGTLITPVAASRGWFVDCAGDMPTLYREASRRWIQCVFADIDHRPPNLHYIEQNVRELVMAALHPQHGGVHAAPDDIYVLCQHGMNRSGLVAGLLLRALGMTGDEAVRRISARRVGSLSNLAFRDIVLRGV